MNAVLPAVLSKRLLGHLADLSKTTNLKQALDALQRAIHYRTQVGSRMQLGLKAATTAHLMICDVETASRELYEEQELYRFL